MEQRKKCCMKLLHSVPGAGTETLLIPNPKPPNPPKPARKSLTCRAALVLRPGQRVWRKLQILGFKHLPFASLLRGFFEACLVAVVQGCLFQGPLSTLTRTQTLGLECKSWSHSTWKQCTSLNRPEQHHQTPCTGLTEEEDEDNSFLRSKATSHNTTNGGFRIRGGTLLGSLS